MWYHGGISTRVPSPGGLENVLRSRCELRTQGGRQDSQLRFFISAIEFETFFQCANDLGRSNKLTPNGVVYWRLWYIQRPQIWSTSLYSTLMSFVILIYWVLGANELNRSGCSSFCKRRVHFWSNEIWISKNQRDPDLIFLEKCTFWAAGVTMYTIMTRSITAMKGDIFSFVLIIYGDEKEIRRLFQVRWSNFLKNSCNTRFLT